MKRRDFIEKGSRWLLLGGLIGTGGYLVFRRSNGNPENCFVSQVCQGCNKNASCDKLAAANADLNNQNGREQSH